MYFSYDLLIIQNVKKYLISYSVVVEIYDLQKTEEANYNLLQEVYFQRI